MGDWNPLAPTRIGSETRLARSRALILDNPKQAYAGRFKAASATVITALHTYLAQSAGGNPGLALEVLTTLAPVTNRTTRFFPGTVTGAVTTGWETQANSVVAADMLATVDDNTVGGYLRNISARSSTSSLDLKYRGATGQQLAAGNRVCSVRMRGRFQLTGLAGNGSSVLVSALLDLGGTVYPHPRPQQVRKNAKWVELVWEWALNPSTNLPWTRTEYNALLDGATDEYGIRVQGKIAAEGFNVAGYFLDPLVCTENRIGFHYDSGTPDLEWAERTLSGTAAPTSGAWHWWLMYALNGTGTNFLRTGLVEAPATPIVASAATTGEQRNGYLVTLTDTGGVVASIKENLGAAYAPVLFDQGGIAAQSQPFIETVDTILDSGESGVTMVGQQITTAAATAYRRVLVPAGWAHPSQRPDAPLTVNIYPSSADAAAGTNSLAVGRLNPEDTVSGDVQDVEINLTAAWTNTLNTQYWVAFTSGGLYGWRLPVADTNSAMLVSATTTQAEIEGTTVGGTTDSWFDATGTTSDRYDLHIALEIAPGLPSGGTATVRDAA